MKISNSFSFPEDQTVYYILIFMAFIISACQGNPTKVSSKNPDNFDKITNPAPETAKSEQSDSSFVVFDGTKFGAETEKLIKAGLTPIHIVYHSHLWGMPYRELKQTSPWKLPPQDRLIKQARRAQAVNSELAILDIEHWPVETSADQWERSLQNYITVLDRFKKAQPELKVGYYDIVPHKNWYAEKPQRVLDSWRSKNDLLAPLAEKVDAFFPNLYTYKKDREYWVESAKLLLEETRRISGDKPVYAFLWPQYWPAQDESLRDEYVDAEFWRLQLQTARKYADGVVIWFPYDTDWQEASGEPWLEVTENFLTI